MVLFVRPQKLKDHGKSESSQKVFMTPDYSSTMMEEFLLPMVMVKIFITEVDKSLAPISKDSLIYTGDIRGGLEGSHVYKINNYYYLYCTYGGVDGIQVALRSKNIYGPYEQKVVLRDTTKGVNFGVHQGALIRTPDKRVVDIALCRQRTFWPLSFIASGNMGR